MRNKVIVGVGAVAVGVLALLLLSLGNTTTGNTHALPDTAPASKAASLSPSKGKAPRLTESSTNTDTLRDRVVLPNRQVVLSSKERRLNETDQDYTFRVKFIDKFDKLIRQAELTPEQVPLVLEKLADAQEQSELAWQAMDESLTSAVGPPVSMSTMSKTLSLDLFASLREVMSHEQMVRYRHISIIGYPLNFGLYKPFDIEREEQK